MKKILFAISALALLTGISTSCQKEIDNLQGSNQSSEFTVTATIADNGSKVSYAEDASNNLKPTWQIDDIVIGFDGSGNTYGYKVTSVDGTGKATMAIITSGDYVGSVTADPTDGTKMYMIYAPGKKPSDISSKSLTVSLGNQSKDIIPALMMASATVSGSSLSLDFEHKTAIIAIKNPTMAAASTAYTGITLVGTGVNTEVKFDLDGSSNLQATYQTPGTITKVVEFTSDGSKAVSGVTYIVACPITSSTDLTFATNYLETFKKTNKTIAAGNYYYMTPTFAGGHAEGILPGVFSVGVTTVVGFSKGNLYYNGSTWNFEATQYDYRTYAGKNSCIGGTVTTYGTPPNHWGLFGWSTNNGTISYGMSTSAGDDYFGDFVDWGNNAIANGGNTTKMWRTMIGGSGGEFEWLLGPSISPTPGTNCRTSSTLNGISNARYAEVKVNGIKGMLIFPDVFAWPSAITTAQPTTFNTISSNWNNVNFTIAEFEKLESAGCVFLPAAGYRNGSTVPDVVDLGYYWSSTASNSYGAYNLFFNIEYIIPAGSYSRQGGYSVRLVSDAN